MGRKRIRVRNLDFYLSKDNVEPIRKITGSLYLMHDEPIDGLYRVSKFKYFVPILDNSRGYIKASDLDNNGINLGI